jgi:hypothetical protein
MINRLLYGIFHINLRRPYGMLAQVPPVTDYEENMEKACYATHDVTFD